VPGEGWHDRGMGRVQGWPDDPNGFHRPEVPKSAVDTCLNCCVVILVVGTIGFFVLAFWVLPQALWFPF
jgi:hypothetical protein